MTANTVMTTGTATTGAAPGAAPGAGRGAAPGAATTPRPRSAPEPPGGRSCVITAWSAVSPFGIGRPEFVAGLAAGTSAPERLDPAVWGPLPRTHARLVPGFEAREVLGSKGTRSMDRATALAVATVGQVLDGSDDGRERATGARAGLVLGTTTGSAQSMMSFTRDSLTGKRPFFVDPARFPNTVMNCASGQCAIWHDLRGPNATVAGGRLAALHALNYGRRLLAADRARTVLAGAVEEFSAARSWLRHAVAPDGEVLGEGCVVLQLEQAGPAPADPSGGAGGRALAEVLAVEFAAFRDDEAAALDQCVGRALARSGTGAEDLWCVVPDPARAARHERILAARLGELGHVVRPDLTGVGDAGAVTAAFEVAAVLALAQADPAAAGRTALVTCVADEGVAGCAVLRLC